ncbi:MAG: efflux RND transporter periplasmic adaptor subunit [Planctomycetota bacterium]|nr:MAG: efflux RND transporter periplasmic adaptor subunit [Planctomycetota bacterium]
MAATPAVSSASRAARRRGVRPGHWATILSEWGLSAITTLGLAAVGWAGHTTHWTFGLGHFAAANHALPAGAAASPGAIPHDVSTSDGEAMAHEELVDEESPGEGDEPADGVVRLASPEALARTGIELVAVEERPLVDEVIATGVVRYDERRTAQLSSRVGGSVWRVIRHLGDAVAKGDVLVIVESREVGRLKADFLNALVAFEARREQVAILDEVKGAVMGRQVREATSALREARNHLTNAEQALVNLGFDVSVAQFDSLDDDARAAKIRTVGVPGELFAGTDPSHITSNLLPIHAPFDGVVIGRDAVVGEVVEAGEPIFELADVSTMWVVLNVSKEDAGRVAIGQALRFRPDGAGEEYSSRVCWVSTEVDRATRTLEVRAEITSPAGDLAATEPPLRANTYGSGRIEVDRRSLAVVVPRDAVQWDGSRWVVFIPGGGGKFTARTVEPGLRDGGMVEVRGGFADGGRPTHVVGQGSHVLKSQVMLDRLERGGPPKGVLKRGEPEQETAEAGAL